MEITKFDKHIQHQLAWLITINWLGSAPGDLHEPQLQELKQLDIKGLFLLLTIDPEDMVDKKVYVGPVPHIIERLKKRRRISHSIRKGMKEGLYDVAEHATSKIDLED